MSTDTPRTDAENISWPLFGMANTFVTTNSVPISFTRQLERELNAANAKIAELEGAIRNLRDVKGRYQSGVAYDRLIALLNASSPE